MTRKKPWQTLRTRLGRASGIALSYTMFLFVCLALLVIIGFTYDSRVRDSYWEQQRSHLTRVSSGMESQLQLMSDYSLQLRTDTTLLRLSNMHDETDANYVLAAYRMMQSLTIRQYGLISLPVIRSTLYLKESNHILTSSESVPAELYYRRTRSFRASEYENWLAAMESAAAKPTFVDYGQFSGRNGELAVLMDISGEQLPSMPVVVAFELDGSALREYLLPENIADAAVYVLSADGTPLFSVGNAVALSPLTFDANQTAFQGEYRILRRVSPSGRQYLLQLPNSLANQATGQFLRIYLLIFLVALVVGALVIIQLIRRAMKPIRQLTTQLDEAEDANAQLQREIDAQRPVINASYLRKLLSGHVASQDEFQYMMESLGLRGNIHHYVLFCVANRQDSEVADPKAEYDTITEALERHLSGAYPLYYYATLTGDFVVLVTYANDDTDSFATLQQHVVQLHDELADTAGLWFYAGVGSRCTQPSRLWESYEQARAASRYTAKHHIFLPYDFIRKDTQSWYYPIEISAKLLHFITTGNKDQTADMFALIHRENIEERSLPLPLRNMLLSDLKNTLFKARFQVLPSQSEEMAAKLKKLDERLYSPTPTFAQLEDDALCLCEFFVKVSSPSTPIPDVERYLQENYTDPSLCLSKVGDRFNISDTYLSHMFKEKTGQNFSVYLERLRMNEAARRLTSGDCNLTALYADLGYTNPTSFRRAFKKYYGMTPSEMRDQPRKQEEKSE